MLHPSIITSRQQRQPPAYPARMQENPYSAERNQNQRSSLHNQARSTTSLYLPDSDPFGRGMLHPSVPRMAGSSANSSFPQTAASGLPRERNSAPFFDTRSTYSYQHPTFDEMRRSDTGLRQDFEIDFAPDQGLFDESGDSSLPTSQDILSPQEFSWQEHDQYLLDNPLSTSADTDYSSYGLMASEHAWPLDWAQTPALGVADSNTLDHPDAIKIGGSDEYYKQDPTSSFPSSANCFTDYMPTMPNREVASTSEAVFPPSSPPNLPFRKNSNKSTSARASRSGSLSIIREYGHSQHGSPILSRNGSGKGKRKGPLPTATALAAAQKRKDGSVCIRCRTMKMTVGRLTERYENWLTML